MVADWSVTTGMYQVSIQSITPSVLVHGEAGDICHVLLWVCYTIQSTLSPTELVVGYVCPENMRYSITYVQPQSIFTCGLEQEYVVLVRETLFAHNHVVTIDA